MALVQCLAELKKRKKEYCVLTQSCSHQPSDTAQPSPPSQAVSSTEPTGEPDWKGKTQCVCSASPSCSRTRPPCPRPTAQPQWLSAGQLRPSHTAPLTHRHLRGNTVTWRPVGQSQLQPKVEKGNCSLTQHPVKGSEGLLGAAQQGVEVSWQDAAGAGVSQGWVVLPVSLCVPAG